VEVSVTQQDVFELSGDALICPANPQLNMSGGINGEMLRRGGVSIQAELRSAMATAGVANLAPSTVVTTGAGPFPYQRIIHAVAIDAFYSTAIGVVTRTIINAWEQAHRLALFRVVMPMLGTGYGRLPPSDFAKAFAKAVGECSHLPLKVNLAVREAETVDLVYRELAITSK
jgi:O-acetyl-ADP-ribose deacetylase